LPGELKLSISACPGQCVIPQIHCLSLVACQNTIDGKQEVGFALLAGGGLSGEPSFAKNLGVFIKQEQAVDVLTKVFQVWNEASDYRHRAGKARFKDLIKDWGIERFEKVLEEKLGYGLQKLLEAKDAHIDSFKDHIGVHAQKKDGYYYIGVPVLGGRMSSDQILKIAELSERYSDANENASSAPIRLTSQQNLIIANIYETHVDKALEGLFELGLSINAHPLRRGVITCTGAEFCKYAHIETKSRVRDLVEYLEKSIHMDEPIRFYVSGCEKACAHHSIANLGLLGVEKTTQNSSVDVVDVYVGGSIGKASIFSHPVFRSMQVSDCAMRLEKLLQNFRKSRKQSEPFNDWCKRIGDSELEKLLSPDEEKEAPVESNEQANVQGAESTPS
jgi:sulfite reductase (ferredoxin)